ncbi:hypothetical protein [Chromobacterium sp. Panama]|nr:hypothetical protein [Chromobacterium sp. Panama]
MRQTALAGQTSDGHYSFIPARSYWDNTEEIQTAQALAAQALILRQIKFK